MTQRLSFNHHDIFDDWDFSDLGPSLCTYLRAKVENEGPVSAIPDQFSLGKSRVFKLHNFFFLFKKNWLFISASSSQRAIEEAN